MTKPPAACLLLPGLLVCLGAAIGACDRSFNRNELTCKEADACGGPNEAGGAGGGAGSSGGATGSGGGEGAAGASGSGGIGGMGGTAQTAEGQPCQVDADCGVSVPLSCAPGLTSPELHCRGNCRGTFDCPYTARSGYECCFLPDRPPACLPPDQSDPAHCH